MVDSPLNRGRSSRRNIRVQAAGRAGGVALSGLSRFSDSIIFNALNRAVFPASASVVASRHIGAKP